MVIDNLCLEKALWQRGVSLIAGVDEVGRGPLAGPVFACAVIFAKHFFLAGVQDSKMLTEKQRQYLDPFLRQNAISYALGAASVQEIDEINIRQATILAMNRAIEKLIIKPDYLLIDGENIPNTSCASMGVVQGDQKSFTIAAASIIAKVARDNLMRNIDEKYPQYRFAKNKGYGTAEHIQVLKRIGPSPYHRHTFLKKILGD